MDLPSVASIEDVPEDFEPRPLGSRQELVRRIVEVVPQSDFRDPAWGLIERDTFTIEVSMGRDDIVQAITFHVRGSGDEAVAVVARVLDHLGLRAVDTESGDFFAPDSAAASFDSWQAFRNDVL
jgi:hypothetical protein